MKLEKEKKFRRTYKQSLGYIRNKVSYYLIDLRFINEDQFKEIRRMFKNQNQNTIKVIKKKRRIKNSFCNNSALHILKNIIPFCVRTFECYLNKQKPKKFNIIDLIENVKKQKLNANQNKKNIQKFEIKELKELIKNPDFVEQFKEFLTKEVEKQIDQNKRIQQEKKQSYKTASKMVLEELNKPVKQKFQRFISKKCNMLKLRLPEKNCSQNIDSQIQYDYNANQKYNYDDFFSKPGDNQNYIEQD